MEDARAGRRLEYFTLGWNFIEAFVAIIAGIVAGSIALVCFGADSLIESFSSVILLWRLQEHEHDAHREHDHDAPPTRLVVAIALSVPRYGKTML